MLPEDSSGAAAVMLRSMRRSRSAARSIDPAHLGR